jgi:hypothetical protein
MGLNINYLHYFKREHVWKALQGVGDFAEPYNHPHATIHFSYQDIILSMMTGFGEKDEIQQDAPGF